MTSRTINTPTEPLKYIELYMSVSATEPTEGMYRTIYCNTTVKHL